MAYQTYSQSGFVAIAFPKIGTAIKVGAVSAGQKYLLLSGEVLFAPTMAELDAIISSQNLTIIS
jgi:hypothetical protein